MASDEEDDYLSDKFLTEQASTSAKPKTYHELRKEAEKRAHEKQEQNRIKPRHQRELESRQEGLSKSLFEREQEEREMGISSGNKALSIMMKMGFTPGQSLGKQHEQDEQDKDNDSAQNAAELNTSEEPEVRSRPKKSAEPIPLQEWQGKEGIGKRRRGPSPLSADRIAKMAKMAEATKHKSFRDQARDEYTQRRAEGRLKPAQLTCITLDEKDDKTFNALWLNPQEPESFPPGLMEAIALNHETLIVADAPSDLRARLRQQMKQDALRPLDEHDELDRNKAAKATPEYSPDEIEESVHFLRLNAQDRLALVLSYLRDRYLYCFWCGTRYEDEDDMTQNCPGEDEDSHD